ncbi:MAG: YraN family protein [Clostridia bacterium]|nr:YraN family protein [Clostridia bacterium]
MKFLAKKGMQILERNYHSKYGEVDIIAKDKEYIIFIEVKTRRIDTISKPVESVDKIKQRKILKTAMAYLQACKYTDLQPRFDIIEIIYKVNFSAELKVASINHIKDAFWMEGKLEDF